MAARCWRWKRLYEGDLLSSTEYWRLAGAYEYLRRLEHLLQLDDDRQTHSLPSKPAELERIARRMTKREESAAEQLLADLNVHLENVQTIYERIVHAQRPLQYGPSLQLLAEPEGVGNEAQERALRRADRALTSFTEALQGNPEPLRLLEENPLLKEWLLQVFGLSP